MPAISVIMPAFNAERFVAESVESVLSQTFKDFELVVVNDGSRDRTAEILDRYRDRRIVRIDHKDNQGLARTLNHGLKAAKGEFVARLDSDDVALPTRLEEQVAFLSRDTGTVIVGSNCEEIDEAGTYIRTWHYPLDDTDIRWHTLFHCSFVHSSVMFRTAILRSNGLNYDVKAVYAQDYELWSRLLSYGRGANIRQPLVKYRTHTRQISQQRLREQNKVRDRVSRMNLKRRGVANDASEGDLGILRKWVMQGPRINDTHDIELGRVLLRILDDFAGCSDVDAKAARDLRRMWVKRLLEAASARQVPALVTSGLLGDVLLRDSLSLLEHGSMRAARRVRRALGMSFEDGSRRQPPTG
jgi:glycosyltransferase involved in cell wall biosynthesis